MEVIGKLHVKMDTQTVSDRFTKRDFVLLLADNPAYPQYITFQLTQEKCSLLDAFIPGADITVSFNLRGRMWTSPQGETKYFNTLEAWRIAPTVTAQPTNVPVNQASHAPQMPSTPAQDITALDDANDLPF